MEQRDKMIYKRSFDPENLTVRLIKEQAKAGISLLKLSRMYRLPYNVIEKIIDNQSFQNKE